MNRREIEMLAADAKDFACLADFVAVALAGTRQDGRVRMSESEADTLLFATLQSRLSAAKAFEAIEVLMRQEDGQ